MVKSHLPVQEASSAPESERPLEREMATHFSILAWEVSWTDDPSQATVHGAAKESDMTYLLNNRQHRYRQGKYKIRIYHFSHISFIFKHL